MSLLGRLEDLSLPDIVQIVYLSRRTGILEIVDREQRWGILFVNGLVANAFAPGDATLLDFLERRRVLSPERIEELRTEVEKGAVIGDLVLSRQLMTPVDLAELVRMRITGLVRPLLTRRTGEFNFLLSDAIGPQEIGYDLENLFRQGGVLPSEILEEGEKAKPLQSLEESMRAGKALLRGEGSGAPAGFGFGEEIEQMASRSRAEEEVEAEEPFDESESPFGELEIDEPVGLFEEEPMHADEEAGAAPAEVEAPFAAPADEEPRGEELPEEESLAEARREASAPDGVTSSLPMEPPAPKVPEKVGSLSAPPQARPISRFRVEGERTLVAEDRNVVLFEQNPMIRVAAKRAFSQNGFQIFQFGRIDEVQKTVNEMLEGNRFFVSFLELPQGSEQETTLLVHQIKRTNRHLPVVVIDAEASLERRHDLLKLGCDMYLTKPSPAHLQPAIADQTLGLYADELVQFADHAVENWESLTQTYGAGDGAVGATLYEIAEKERLNRTRTVMRSLINELADPDDINQLAQTILRLADEYLDRAALFATSPTRFIGLGGFGPTGTDRDMNDLVRRIRIARDEDSVLRDVTFRGKTHRGKLRRTDGNVKLLDGIGAILPTQVVVIPIENYGAPVGVLYGDNGGQRSPIGRISGLEIFLEQAGLALHNSIVTNARRKGFDWDTK